MKKIIGIIALFVGVTILVPSCSKSESYADKVKKERKAIQRFIDNNDIDVLENYPSDGVFGENQYYRDPSGVYIHVVDSGTGERAKLNSTEYRGTDVSVRYKETYYFNVSDTAEYHNMYQNGIHDYIEFQYGNTNTYTETTGSYISEYYFKSEGMVTPLKYVGNKAIIKLLVPFSVGSYIQQTQYEPVHFGYLQYIFLD